ncbi:hypothetical protein BC826DRAFT_972401 [Russula brevipes]|nr:hypothetical protein BC826DRAFT_972401 [Russula brevipes]
MTGGTGGTGASYASHSLVTCHLPDVGGLATLQQLMKVMHLGALHRLLAHTITLTIVTIIWLTLSAYLASHLIAGVDNDIFGRTIEGYPNHLAMGMLPFILFHQ